VKLKRKEGREGGRKERKKEREKEIKKSRLSSLSLDYCITTSSHWGYLCLIGGKGCSLWQAGKLRFYFTFITIDCV